MGVLLWEEGGYLDTIEGYTYNETGLEGVDLARLQFGRLITLNDGKPRRDKRRDNRRNATLALTAITALSWCVMLVIGTYSVYYQYQQGAGSLFLIEIGVLAWLFGLLVCLAGPIFLMRSLRTRDALVFAFGSFTLSIPIFFFFVVGLGANARSLPNGRSPPAAVIAEAWLRDEVDVHLAVSSRS